MQKRGRVRFSRKYQQVNEGAAPSEDTRTLGWETVVGVVGKLDATL